MALEDQAPAPKLLLLVQTKRGGNNRSSDVHHPFVPSTRVPQVGRRRFYTRGIHREDHHLRISYGELALGRNSVTDM